MNKSILAAITSGLFLLPFSLALAGSATWNLNPGSNDWSTSSNWTPVTVPNGPADIATFNVSNTQNVTVSSNIEVDSIAFSARGYTIGVSGVNYNSCYLTLNGAGITNNSATFNIGYGPTGIRFLGSATAANAKINNNGGSVSFGNTSTAGTAQIGTVSGPVLFSDNASAGSANIQVFPAGSVGFGGSSSAGNSTIYYFDNSTYLSFSGSASAGNATIGGAGTSISFTESSTGATAHINVGNFDTFRGSLDISQHSPPGMVIGSLSGPGDVYLGSKTI